MICVRAGAGANLLWKVWPTTTVSIAPFERGRRWQLRGCCKGGPVHFFFAANGSGSAAPKRLAIESAAARARFEPPSKYTAVWNWSSQGALPVALGRPVDRRVAALAEKVPRLGGGTRHDIAVEH